MPKGRSKGPKALRALGGDDGQKGPSGPTVVFAPPGPENVRFQDWAHDHGMRRMSAGTWASRVLGPPERAKDIVSVDRERLVRELVNFHVAEDLNERKRPEGSE